MTIQLPGGGEVIDFIGLHSDIADPSVKHEFDFTQLPPEIWRDIIEISAGSSMRQASLLSKVCKTFHSWTQPILLRTAVHYSENSGWPMESPNLFWFQQHGQCLRNILWGLNKEMDLLASILEHCPFLENLGVWVHVPNSNVPVIGPALSKLRLRQISINPFALFSSSFFGKEHAEDPMFTCVTHFYVIVHTGAAVWEDVAGLAYIPKLSHIGLHTAQLDAVNGAHEHCKAMEVLIVPNLRRNTETIPVPIEELGDKLVVPALRSIKDWEAGTMGGLDCWKVAESELAKRRNRLEVEERGT